MDPGTQEFIHCLVASTDYDSFYSVMVREASKLEFSQAQSKKATPVVAEAKGSASSSKGGKGTDDDDDDDDVKGYK